MSTETSSSKDTVQRKGMRKGTHSCFECRRRKTRCIFRSDEPNICVSCSARGSECVEQRREHILNAADKTKSNLKERVAKLEAIIEAAGLSAQDVAPHLSTTKTPDDPIDSTSHVDESPLVPTESGADKATLLPSSHHSTSVSENTDSPQEIDPVANLFNNAFWRRKSPDETNEADIDGISHTRLPTNSVDSRTFIKRRATREALLSVLPAPELLGEILNITYSWWNAWKPLGPWVLDAAVNERPKTLQEFVLWALSSENPSIVGLGILSIAVSIQQLDSKQHGHVLMQLSRPVGELFRDLFDSVDRLIVNDSEFASSTEGIEVIIMSGKLLMNFGLLKKCWVLNHRAGSYAQLLGLHRPQRLFQNESDEARAGRHRSWLSICQADQILSLLLGLPYYAHSRTMPASILGESGTRWSFQVQLISLTARVIDRNQMGLSLSLQTTQDIQKDLDSLARQMDKDFWDIKGSLEQRKITREEYYESITAQFWYHIIRHCLHMPLFIQSIKDPRLGSPRELCLDACRDTLQTYNVMRSDSSSAFDMVKVIDYEAFMCSSILLLGMMGYGSTQYPFVNLTRDQDRDLILLTLNTLRRASISSGNTIASEAVQGLEVLMSLADGKCCNQTGENSRNPYARVVVPYSGTITISPGTFFTSKQIALEDPATNLTPVFTFSHDDFNSKSNQNQIEIPVNAQDNSFGSFDFNNNVGLENFVVPDYPSIEFDWGSMINMNTEEDWAWLMDVNSYGLNVTL